MLRIGVLVSGSGTNLQAIIDKIESSYIKNCKIATVVSNKRDVYALERAKKHNIPSICIEIKNFQSKEEFDNAIIKHLESCEVDVVVLAGFLSILGVDFIKKFKNKIINVHPSLIPSFCGKGYYGIIPHQKALEYGVKVTGATVHFVDFGADEGPIILQKAVYIEDDDTPDSLQKRVMEEAEWEILPESLKLIAEGKVKVNGRKVSIIN